LYSTYFRYFTYTYRIVNETKDSKWLLKRSPFVEAFIDPIDFIFDGPKVKRVANKSIVSKEIIHNFYEKFIIENLSKCSLYTLRVMKNESQKQFPDYRFQLLNNLEWYKMSELTTSFQKDFNFLFVRVVLKLKISFKLILLTNFVDQFLNFIKL